MSNGLTRLQSRFLANPESVGEVLKHRGPLATEEAERAGLITFAPDDLDWEDEIRVAIEERYPNGNQASSHSRNAPTPRSPRRPQCATTHLCLGSPQDPFRATSRDSSATTFPARAGVSCPRKGSRCLVCLRKGSWISTFVWSATKKHTKRKSTHLIGQEEPFKYEPRLLSPLLLPFHLCFMCPHCG